jgi:dihydropteroate synthase
MKIKHIVEYEITIILSHTTRVDKKGEGREIYDEVQKYINKQTITYKTRK